MNDLESVEELYVLLVYLSPSSLTLAATRERGKKERGRSWRGERAKENEGRGWIVCSFEVPVACSVDIVSYSQSDAEQ